MGRAWICHSTHMDSEDNLWESALFFYLVGLDGWTHIVRLDHNCLFLLCYYVVSLAWFLFLEDRLSCSSDWLWSHYITESGLRSTNPLISNSQVLGVKAYSTTHSYPVIWPLNRDENGATRKRKVVEKYKTAPFAWWALSLHSSVQSLKEKTKVNSFHILKYDLQGTWLAEALERSGLPQLPTSNDFTHKRPNQLSILVTTFNPTWFNIWRYKLENK